MKKIDDKQVVKLIEAAVFVADKPLSKNQIKSTVLSPYQVSAQQFNRAIKQLIADYQDRGIVFLEVASGYRFQAIDEVAEELSLLFQEKPPKYSRALLETLALIAYKQPITRGEIEEVRGVAVSSHIMKTLQDREWIKVVGNKEVPGRPALYATTKAFLDYFSLTSLAQLPELMPVPTMNLADDLTPIKESADSA